ncbi:MAG TPA: HAMP domain-containing protein, partial [Longimicrobiaceae bacterium]|nr:HAMP domain-containing protein [Longimicrobiaceae bacterium]
MIESVRVRLALWHSGVLAVLLLAFAAGTYSYLARSGLQRTDELLREAARAFIVELDAASGGANPALSTTAEVARDFRLGGTRVLVFDAGARLVAASPVGRHQRHADPERIARALAGRPFATTLLFTVPDSGGSYRVYTTPTEVGPRRYVVAVVESLRELRASLDGVRDTFVLAIPLALLLSALGGYVLARRSLAPVSLMSERAARIGAGNLDERLPVPNPRDELGRLARTFNELLARL